MVTNKNDYNLKKNKEEVLKKWREGLQNAKSLVEAIFTKNKKDFMTYNELIKELELVGIDYDDVHDVINEAQRAKVILSTFPKSKAGQVAFEFIKPERREQEKKKTERLLKMVDDIFTTRGVEAIPQDELKEILKLQGLLEKEVKRAIDEAEANSIISLSFDAEGRAYHWTKPEERELEPIRRRLGTWFFHKWLDKKARQGQIDKDV